uniref:DUF6598 domain-containing protein n=1 Tax=Aegilops tauschii TaxID=37682 RepID=R7WB77_AEGTA
MSAAKERSGHGPALPGDGHPGHPPASSEVPAYSSRPAAGHPGETRDESRPPSICRAWAEIQSRLDPVHHHWDDDIPAGGGNSDHDPLEADAGGEVPDCPAWKSGEEKATKVAGACDRVYTRRSIEYLNKYEEIWASAVENATFPSRPLSLLRMFPEATGLCAMRGYCHHREFKTHDTSTTRSTIGHREPRLMLQIFSLSLSSFGAYPLSVYGIVAVRDALEPLRNLVFTVPAEMILSRPSQGMYYMIRERALLEVDLRVKEEGDGSSDKRLLSVYAEIDGGYDLDQLLDEEVSSDLGSLVVDYLFLDESVEAVIQVSARIDRLRHVRFTAFTSGFNQEIVLFDDKLSGNGKLFRHVVAVKAKGKLDIYLKLEEPLLWWIFQEGVVGAARSPDDQLLDYAQFDEKRLGHSMCPTKYGAQECARAHIHESTYHLEIYEVHLVIDGNVSSHRMRIAKNLEINPEINASTTTIPLTIQPQDLMDQLAAEEEQRRQAEQESRDKERAEMNERLKLLENQLQGVRSSHIHLL